MTNKHHMWLSFLPPILFLYFLVWLRNGGNFTYTLDDPYIHLALARNIWGGSYGINVLEHSAPSSSVIWPYILAPFSALPNRIFEYLPLLINTVCAVTSGYWIFRLFSELGAKTSLVLGIVFMLTFNVYGLVFTGMEHNLQVMCIIVVAYGVSNFRNVTFNRDYRFIFYLCLTILPLVRYEGLAISLPILGLMLFKGDRTWASLSTIIIILFLGTFSFHLHALGLGFLPSSVLAKSSHTGIRSILENAIANVRMYGWLLALVTAYCMYLWKLDRAFSIAIVTVTTLHFLFGKYGWYGRYEVYYVLFLGLLMTKSLVQCLPKSWVYLCSMPLAFPTLIYATLTTPLAASNVHQQQAQMAEIARLLDEKIAVHDLGLVALRGNNYVLDLWGLGSIEALKLRNLSPNDPQWISRLMKEKGVEYAFVYDSWFPIKPADWIKVGELKLRGKQITANYHTVSLYSVTSSGVGKLTSVLKSYKTTNPSTDIIIHAP